MPVRIKVQITETRVYELELEVPRSSYDADYKGAAENEFSHLGPLERGDLEVSCKTSVEIVDDGQPDPDDLRDAAIERRRIDEMFEYDRYDRAE